MISSGRLTPREAFPDLFEAEEVTGADLDGALADAETGIDYSGVKWESPGEADYDKLMSAMRTHSTITTRDTSGPTEGVKTEEIPLEPDDTEWI